MNCEECGIWVMECTTLDLDLLTVENHHHISIEEGSKVAIHMHLEKVVGTCGRTTIYGQDFVWLIGPVQTCCIVLPVTRMTSIVRSSSPLPPGNHNHAYL